MKFAEYKLTFEIRKEDTDEVVVTLVCHFNVPVHGEQDATEGEAVSRGFARALGAARHSEYAALVKTERLGADDLLWEVEHA